MSALSEPEICRNILESLPTGVCVIDLQKKIVFWSDGAERITGHLRHEVIGHSCVGEALLHCDDVLHDERDAAIGRIERRLGNDDDETKPTEAATPEKSAPTS